MYGKYLHHNTYTNFYKKNDCNLYIYIISLITRDKAIRVKLSIFRCIFKLFINCLQVMGILLICKLYTYFLINRRSRSSRRLRLSLIGPGILFCNRIYSGERFMEVLWDTLNHDKIL